MNTFPYYQENMNCSERRIFFTVKVRDFVANNFKSNTIKYYDIQLNMMKRDEA